MKLRIIVYGLLLLLLVCCATVYLIYVNQGRILDAARSKLTVAAKEEWGLELRVGRSRLGLTRNAAIFHDVTLADEARGFSIAVERIELIYSLPRLVAGEVMFPRILATHPVVHLTWRSNQPGLPPRKGSPLGFDAGGVIGLLSFIQRLDIEDAEIAVRDEHGAPLFTAGGVGVSLDVSPGRSGDARIWVQKVEANIGPWHGRGSGGFVHAVVDAAGCTVQKAEISTVAGPLSFHGTILAAGLVDLEYSLEADLADVARSIENSIALDGKAEAKGHFRMEESGWATEARVATHDLVIAGEPIPDCLAHAALDAGHCVFTAIEGGIEPRGKLKGSGLLTWSPGRFSYAFDLQAQDVRLASVSYLSRTLPNFLLQEAGSQSGKASFGCDYRDGHPPDWKVELDLAGAWERIFGPETVAVAGVVRPGEGGTALLDGFTLAAATTHAAFHGVAAGPEGTRIEVEAGTAQLGALLAPWELGWIEGSGKATGVIAVRDGDLAVHAGLRCDAVTVKGVVFKSAEGIFDYRDGLYRLTDLVLNGEPGRAALTAEFRPGEPLTGRGQVVVAGLRAEDAEKFLGFPAYLRGRVTGTVAFNGPLTALTGSGDLNGGHLVVRDWPVDWATGRFTFSPQSVNFIRLEVQARGAEGRFSGSWRFDGPVEGKVELSAPELASLKLGAPLTGGLFANGTVHGNPQDPDFSGTVRLSHLAARGVALGDLVLKAEKKGATATAKGALLERYPLGLEISLRTPYLLQAELEVNDLGLEKDVFPLLRSQGLLGSDALLDVRGRAAGTIRARIPLAAPGETTAKLELRQLEITVAEVPSRLVAPVTLSWAGGALSVGALSMRGEQHTFDLGGEIKDGQIAASVKGVVDLSFLRGRFPYLTEFVVRPDFSVRIEGPLAAPRMTGRAELKGGRIGLPHLREKIEEVSGTIRFSQDLITFESFGARIGERRLEAAGTYHPATREMFIHLTGAIPLTYLDYPLPGIKEFSGEGRLTVDFRGTPDNPRLSARLGVEGGMVRFREFAAMLKDFRADISVEDEHIRVREASGQINGGLVKVSGYLVWPFGGELESVSLRLMSEKIFLSYPGTFKLFASTDVTFSGAPGNFLLDGRLVLERGKYFRKMTPKQGFFFQPRAQAILQEGKDEHPYLSSLRLNVDIVGEGGFLVDNNVAHINAGLNMHLQGTALEPRIGGEINLIDGKVYFMGKQFKVTEAEVRFGGEYPPDPLINAEATVMVKTVTVTFVVHGRLSQPTLDFYSDPPYSQEDIFSLLIMGAPRSSLDSRGQQVSNMGALNLFSGLAMTRVGEETRSITGLEVFQIEPTMGERGGAARVVLGKQVSDRLYLSYSRNLSMAEDEQYSVEYQLFDSLSLVGHQDSKGVYSFDLVFSLEVPPWR